MRFSQQYLVPETFLHFFFHAVPFQAIIVKIFPTVFLFQLRLYPGDTQLQLPILHRLHNIVITAQPDCLLCIRKIRMSRQKDHCRFRPVIHNPGRQFNPTDHRHLNIRNYKINLVILNVLHSLTSGIGHIYLVDPQLFPVYSRINTVCHITLIIYNQCFQSLLPPLPEKRLPNRLHPPAGC